MKTKTAETKTECQRSTVKLISGFCWYLGPVPNKDAVLVFGPFTSATAAADAMNFDAADTDAAERTVVFDVRRDTPDDLIAALGFHWLSVSEEERRKQAA